MHGSDGDTPHPVGRRAFLLGSTALAGAGLAVASGRLPASARPAGSRSADRPSPQTVWGWLPRPAHQPGHLIVVDAADTPGHTLVALAIMQGLANARLTHNGAAAYLRIPPTPNVYPEGVFNLWPKIYSEQLGITFADGSATDIARLARSRGVDRFVTWDPDVPATINVATTLAWIHGTAAFSPSDADGPLASGMSLASDLRDQHFANDQDAYRWALDQLPSSGARTLSTLSDGGPDSYLPNALVWTPRDYAVHAHAFTWIGSFEGETIDGDRAAELFSDTATVCVPTGRPNSGGATTRARKSSTQASTDGRSWVPTRRAFQPRTSPSTMPFAHVPSNDRPSHHHWRRASCTPA